MNWADDLSRLKQQQLYRCRRVGETGQGTVINVEGKKLTNFCSNDYLGLANHPEISRAFKKAVDQYGTGSGSAHLICGHTRAHHALEEELAEFTGRQKALLFSTGYMANLGVISALLNKSERVLEDRLNHASLLDGGLLSGARFSRFRHRDMGHLKERLCLDERRTLVVTDGVFSMDGDLAPLPEMVKQIRSFNASLMVDDAHGLAVLGKTGGGVLQLYGLSQKDVPVLMGTLGKGFGTFGAFVAGSDELIETLIQKARTYIYTTALPAAIAEATRMSLKIVSVDSWRREKLQMLIRRFRTGAVQLGLPVMESETAIQPILVNDSGRVMTLSNKLFDRGFWISAIRPPTVPHGESRLRVTFSADHEIHQVDALLEALEAVFV